MTVLFVVCAALLFQAYFGYPLSLILWCLVSGDRSRHRSDEVTPSLTLVISAYNEERIIRQKLLNTLELDYPEERIRRLVVSDGSTDETEAIVRELSEKGIELRSFPGRQGKVACLNQVIPTIESELVVMSDSNSMYSKDSLRRLVRHFADEKIGCVCGRLIYANPKGLSAGEGESVYWAYEGMIKMLESSIGSLLGANGAIYAYRRRLFRPVEPLMFCDDVIPVRIALQGYMTIYDPEAWCTEEACDERAERNRRARHASFGFRSMLQLVREALSMGRPGVVYQCVSHRILRWIGGLVLAGLLISSPFLPTPWRAPALGVQAIFYLLGTLGYLTRRTAGKASPFYLPYYYLVITAAGLKGLWATLRKTDRPYWDPRL